MRWPKRKETADLIFAESMEIEALVCEFHAEVTRFKTDTVRAAHAGDVATVKAAGVLIRQLTETIREHRSADKGDT